MLIIKPAEVFHINQQTYNGIKSISSGYLAEWCVSFMENWRTLVGKDILS